MSEVRITTDDLRVNGHCASGIREFFTLHGCDLRKLVTEGLPLADVAHIHDANLDAVIATATARTEAENV